MANYAYQTVTHLNESLESNPVPFVIVDGKCAYNDNEFVILNIMTIMLYLNNLLLLFIAGVGTMHSE
jgi:uridine kinase